MANPRSPIALLAAGVVGLALAACVSPVPSLGYGDTRGNLTATTALPVGGRTTREEVLLRLGSPDVVAPDDSRFGYTSRRHEGGVGVWGIGQLAGGVPLGGVVEFTERRLVVDFDAQGVANRVQLDEIRCTKTVGPFAPGGACLGYEGLGLSPLGEAGRFVAPEPTIATFADAIVVRSVLDAGDRTPSEDLYGWTQNPRRGLRESKRIRGPVAVSDTAIIATAWESVSPTGRPEGEHRSAQNEGTPATTQPAKVRVAFADIDDFACHQFGSTTSGTTMLLLTTHRGLAVSIMVMSSGALGGPDNPATERLIGIVEAKLGRAVRPQ
jgi:outer membrane protein assembly factor BamE (lipoprotein component of BamABCDE complex)